MENIGDWLYMVIIIIAAISSFIGSINKKNKQTTGKRQPREIVTEDWENKESRNKHTETQHSVSHQKTSGAYHQQKQQTTSPGYGLFNKSKEKDYSTFKKETTDSSLNMEDPDEEKTAVSLDDMPENTNEWRKAFIYNEVFKRKY